MNIKKICKHNNKIAEREFYIKQKNKIIGTRIICLSCGYNTFIIDKNKKYDTSKKSVCKR